MSLLHLFPLLLLSTSTSTTSTSSTLSHQDLQNLGTFLANLARELKVSVASVCLYFPQVSEVKEIYNRLAYVLFRNLVFALPCTSDPTQPSSAVPPPPTACPSPTPRPSDSSSWLAPCHQRSHADFHIIAKGQGVVAEKAAVKRYGVSSGAVRQVVVGRDITPSRHVVAGIASWILASYSKEKETVRVQEVFSFSDSAETVVQQLGLWQVSTSTSGPSTYSNNTSPTIPTPVPSLQFQYPPGFGPADFQGHILTLATFPYPPYTMAAIQCPDPDYKTEIQGQGYHHDPRCISTQLPYLLGDVRYVGYFMDIFNTLARKMNFRYQLVFPDVPPDNYTFGMGRSDNYSGLVGMIYRQEADIALASFSISLDRLDVMDFSVPVEKYVRNLYIRSNATKSIIGWGTYALSFSGGTWVMSVVLLMVTSLCLWVISCWERPALVPPDIYSLNDITFMFFSCFVQQGVPTTPESLRGRAVFWLFWWSCVILYANYTALLTSHLTVNTQTPPFSTFREAVDSYPDWNIGIIRGTPLRQFIEEAKPRNYQLLSQRLNANPGLIVDGETKGVEKLLTQDFVFLTDSPMMQYTYRDNCSIREIKVELFPNYGRLGYVKNLPFAGVMDKELSRLSDSGVLKRMRSHWWGRAVPCGETSFTRLDFTHTATAFLMLFMGFILSPLFLALEKFYYRRNRKHTKIRKVMQK